MFIYIRMPVLEVDEVPTIVVCQTLPFCSLCFVLSPTHLSRLTRTTQNAVAQCSLLFSYFQSLMQHGLVT